MGLALQEADTPEPQAGQLLLLGLEDMQVSAQDARISVLSGQYPTDGSLFCSRGSCSSGLFAWPSEFIPGLPKDQMGCQASAAGAWLVLKVQLGLEDSCPEVDTAVVGIGAVDPT